MDSRYEVEVTVVSAKNLKNVNWKHGDLRPYVVLWVDPAAKCSTKVAVEPDDDGEDPFWDEKVTLPLPPGCNLDDAVLYVDVVHAKTEEDTKPLVGSARLPLREVVDEAGVGGRAVRTLKLKRPSRRPQGKLEVKVAVREPARYYQPPAPSYGYQYREYGYGAPYGGAPAPAPSGYSSYGAPAPDGYGYGQPSSYGQQPYAVADQGQKKSKFGVGTGLAVGAAAGVLGGLALAEGVDYVEDKIADEAAEKVEEDLGYDDF